MEKFQSFNDLVDNKDIKMTDTYREMQSSDNRVVESSLNLQGKNETNK